MRPSISHKRLVAGSRSKTIRNSLFLMATLAASAVGHAQVKVTLSDLFTQPGLYYRAYANNFNSSDITGSTAYIVPSNLIGSAGPDQFWDFSKGPNDKVFRFDYTSTEGMSLAAEFPFAKMVERKTEEGKGSPEYLFFEAIPGMGRKVYGYYAENPFFSPVNVFIPPIVDFPDPITYGAEWTTSTVYENELSLNDPDPEGGGLFEISQRITASSHFNVDAHGTIVLPDEIGVFAQGLRINEDVTYDFEIDFGDGQYEHVETDYTRNYYWVMPGYGIVAQLNSTQNSAPPPEKFTRATAFLRLFETNKKISSTGGSGCNAPLPVTDVRIRVSSGVILLTWSKVECASQYSVQYTSTPMAADSWKSLGDPTQNAMWLGENIRNGPARFYRVVSIK